MEVIACLLLLALTGFAQCNDNSRVESEGKLSRQDQEAYESFGAPVYGTTVSGAKSGSYPVPPTVPAGYSSYLTSLGLPPYSRYGVLPYPSPYYNYGGPYNALPYGYASGLNSVFGSGLAYNNPGFSKDGYSVNVNGFPGYAGYRFGGLGYNSAYFRAPGVPAPLSSPYGTIPSPLQTGVVPLAYPGVPAPLGSVPAPVPAVAGRPSIIATQAKDGSLRYTYSPPPPPYQ